MLDWDHLQSFLAVARHGNLSAAARALRVTQTTMGRRLEALHSRAGARLLQKTPAGFTLTQSGEQVLASVERMEVEALSVERTISGEDERIAGEVRITTVEMFGARVVTPMLLPLLERQPELQVELIASDQSLSLSRREADIAIRLAQFEQHEVVVKRIADIAFGLYASRDYLDRRGRPDFDRAAAGHTVVTLQQDLALLPEAQRLASVASGTFVLLRSNSRIVHLQAVHAGYGLGFLPCYLAHELADLVELDVPGGHILRGVWLGVHRDTRHIRRIRVVVDHITREMRAWNTRLVPDLVPTPPNPAGQDT